MNEREKEIRELIAKYWRLCKCSDPDNFGCPAEVALRKIGMILASADWEKGGWIDKELEAATWKEIRQGCKDAGILPSSQ